MCCRCCQNLFKFSSRRNPPSKDLLIKMPLHAKLSFLHTLFLENEAQIDQNKYGTMFFMSKQVSLSKIGLILQKMKISQKPIYTCFAQRPSLGNSRKYPYPTMESFHVLTPPCLRKFQNALPPHNREPPLQNFCFFGSTFST